MSNCDLVVFQEAHGGVSLRHLYSRRATDMPPPLELQDGIRTNTADFVSDGQGRMALILIVQVSSWPHLG